MGVLKNLTNEYFCEKVRDEEVVFRYSIDDENPPKHTLTPDEEAFLQGLARYKLFLDKSLFFQIEDLQRHTELVLSGERREHWVFPDQVEVERELAELDGMIENFEEKLERGEMTPEEIGIQKELLGIWKEQRKELNKALGNTKTEPYLGLYFNNGGESKVTLYLDTIESCAKEPYETMLLMGQVLLHEYFHSFFFHVGVGIRYPMRCVEEPMAEYGSLMVLDCVASSKEHIAPVAKDALQYAIDFVEKKQFCTGVTAAYGFGAHLYYLHRVDFQSLIAKYANASRMMDNCSKESLEYKYLLYPKYPAPWIEDVAFEKLKEILKIVVVRAPSSTRFILNTFRFLRDNDLLDCLAPFIQPEQTKNPRRIFSISQNGSFCLTSILCDDSTPPQMSSFCPLVIEGHTYYLRTPAIWNDKSKTSRHPRPIDEFIKMIEYVYHGQFDIRETADEYIMSYEIV